MRRKILMCKRVFIGGIILAIIVGVCIGRAL